MRTRASNVRLTYHGARIAEFAGVESGKRSDRLEPHRRLHSHVDGQQGDLGIADMLGANPLTLPVLAAAAERERNMSTPSSPWAAAKARGIKPGYPKQAEINQPKAAAQAQAVRRLMPRATIAPRWRGAHRMPLMPQHCADGRAGIQILSVKILPAERRHRLHTRLVNFDNHG
jgi:hypothetical protein